MNKLKRGKTNAKTVYQAREFRRAPTLAEEKLWDALRHRRLADLKFRRQHPFGAYILDFYCVEHQLEVEVDGGIHLDHEQKMHDERRAEFLHENNIRILRFANEEIMTNLDSVLKKIVQSTHSPSPNAGLAFGEGAEGEIQSATPPLLMPGLHQEGEQRVRFNPPPSPSPDAGLASGEGAGGEA